MLRQKIIAAKLESYLRFNARLAELFPHQSSSSIANDTFVEAAVEDLAVTKEYQIIGKELQAT